mgnify:CR=1 FL=1
MFPEPRHVERLPGTGSLEVRSVSADASLPAQGYELVVSADGTEIRHRDAAGLRYARHTLAALDDGRPVRAQRIVDHPDFARRGFMLDISRDRVPTPDTLARLVDVLAELRYNHLELYMEHTFAYAGHELVWGDASPLTADELRDLDRQCADLGIELVANQNTFGHMERWLRHDVHRWRAECPDGATSPFTGGPMAPATLAPTPEPVIRQQTTQAVRAQIDPILKEIMGDTERAALRNMDAGDRGDIGEPTPHAEAFEDQARAVRQRQRAAVAARRLRLRLQHARGHALLRERQRAHRAHRAGADDQHLA